MPKILVVEDSPTMRKLIVSVLDGIDDCDVVDVANGFEALRRLPRERFGLIVTDINMPEINGLELIAFIRDSLGDKTTPILIVTTEDTQEDRRRGLALGANDYVTKPFEPVHLADTAMRLLASAPAS